MASLFQLLVPFLFSILLFPEWAKGSPVHHRLPKISSISKRSYASGVMIYTQVSNGTYILLGQEQQGHGYGTWCIMRGAADGSDTTVQTALKEMEEESGGVYQIEEEHLAKFPFIQSDGGTFIVPAEYVPEEIFNRRAGAHHDPHFREMNNYVWANLSDLRTALQANQEKFSVRNPSGQTKKITLRDCAHDIFLFAETQGFLARIPHGIQAEPMKPVWAKSSVLNIEVSKLPGSNHYPWNGNSWGEQLLMRRHAHDFCVSYDTNFLGGLFNGHIWNGHMGVLGINKEIAYSTYYYSRESKGTIESYDWRKMARRAHNACTENGYASGFFNGHYISSGTMGLICIEKSNAKEFLVGESQVSGDSYTFTGADRSAHNWCEAKRWTTGFLTGHEGYKNGERAFSLICIK